MQLTTPATADQLRHARRCLLETGEVPEGLVGKHVSQSWQRSAMAGLSPVAHPFSSPLGSRDQLRQALACEHSLLSHARPVMDFLSSQMEGSDSIIILSDAQGLLLHSQGDTDFLARAERVSLSPGALWREEHRGTNAIGTALADGQPVVIHGAEHYLERNSFLTCSAAPVRAPDGRVRGVLDISVDHGSGYHAHTFALVRSAARMIEDRLFHAHHAHDQLLRLHPHAEGLGAVGEGLLAFSDDGWVMGANITAQQWLGLSPSQIGAITLERLFGAQARRLQSLPGNGQPARIITRTGHQLFVRDEPARRRRVWAAAAPREQADQRTMHLGRMPGAAPLPSSSAQADARRADLRVSQALRRALRVQAQGIPVLLQGESGTGKEVFARALHAQGPRAGQPFVAVNCAALPEGLIEAELFGYVGGAFTGARREGSPGRIRQANGGTLFLDEIGDMPQALQARLLRVLQDKHVTPVGGGHPVPVDFVLICATHHRLRDAVHEGRFREDLYWRINGLTEELPPLRERGDIAELIDDMLTSIARDMKRDEPPGIADDVMSALLQHPWPGNLRQLNGVLRTACALASPHDTTLHWEHFSQELWHGLTPAPRHEDPVWTACADAAPRPSGTLGDASSADVNLRRLSNSMIARAIQASGGNMSEAARQLGISRNTLYRRLKQHS